jgi:death-on-curing family protein
VRELFNRVVCVRYGADEPLPDWSQVDEGKLSSALNAPQPVFGEDKYPTVEAKAAVLLYSVAKAHSLPNGNKRTAIVTMFLFLAANDKWWVAESEDVRAHVAWIAASEARARDEALAYMTKYLATRLIDVARDALPDLPLPMGPR